MLTYIVYLGLLLCCYFLSLQAERSNKKIYLFVIIILLTIISGFRANTVGVDTKNYIDKFETIADGHPEYAYGLEEGFKIICTFLLKVCNHSTFILIVIAGVTNFFIISRIWDFKDIASVPCMVLCYYTQFYFMTMNVMRQFLAISILFYFTRYLEKKRYIKFTVIILLASYFAHRSALVGVLFLALELTQWRHIYKNQKIILCSGLLVSPVVLLYIVSRVERYGQYFQEANFNFGFMIPTKILFLLGIIALQSNLKINMDKDNNHNTTNYKLSTVKVYYVIGLLISMLGYLFSYMDRIGWYFYIFEGCCLGSMLKNRKYKSMVLIYIIVLLGYSFLTTFLNMSQGVIPYRFIWNS